MPLEPHLNTCKLNQSANGAGFTSLALFFLILFASDILLRHVTLATLGIIVTLSTLSLLSLVVLILFVL